VNGGGGAALLWRFLFAAAPLGGAEMALPFREAGSLLVAAAPLLPEVAKKNAIAETSCRNAKAKWQRCKSSRRLKMAAMQKASK